MAFLWGQILGKNMGKLKTLTTFLKTSLLTIALSGLVSNLSNCAGQQAIASESSPLSYFHEIQKRGKLIIGIKDNLPPLGFRDRDGNLAGLEIDIARELAKELNMGLELRAVKNRDRLSQLTNNQLDIAIAQITITNNRLRLVDFSVPYYTDSTIAIAERTTTLSDLARPSAIAVIKNSDAIAAIQSKFPKSAIVGANSYEEGLAALQSGKVKAFVGDRTNLHQWLIEHPDYAIIGQPLAFHSLAIALPRGLQHQELRDRVLPIVQKWRQNGWLQERINYWGLANSLR